MILEFILPVKYRKNKIDTCLLCLYYDNNYCKVIKEKINKCVCNENLFQNKDTNYNENKALITKNFKVIKKEVILDQKYKYEKIYIEPISGKTSKICMNCLSRHYMNEDCKISRSIKNDLIKQFRSQPIEITFGCTMFHWGSRQKIYDYPHEYDKYV